jgi:hypothetical protein
VFILNAIFFIPDFNSQSVNASVACTQVNRNLDNGKIRFSTGGGGQDNSILTTGLLRQPFFYDTSTATPSWEKLTFSDRPLEAAIGTGTSGSNWTTGTVQDLTSPLNDTLTVNYDSFTTNAIRGTACVGTGTITTQATFTVNSDSLTVINSYTLDSTTSFLKVRTSIRNDSPRVVSNVYFWTGTGDDWLINDSPRKTRGNIVNGSFDTITATTQRAKVLELASNVAGRETVKVLFYSNFDEANAVSAASRPFSSSYNLNPNVAPITHVGDFSYAISFLMSTSLAIGATTQAVDWYYVPGSASELAATLSVVAEDSGATATPSSNPPAAPAIPRYCAKTEILSVTPRGGSSVGGTRINIDGRGLTSAVYIDNSIANVRISSENRVVVVTPPSQKGIAIIRIDGCNSSASSNYFYDPDPLVSSISKNVISTSGGLLEILGEFLSGAKLFVDGVSAPILLNADSQITAQIPASTSGDKTLTLQTAFGSTSFKLKFIDPPILPVNIEVPYIAEGDFASLSFSSYGATSYISSGALPNGLKLNQATGQISGLATQAGIYTFYITATNEVGSDTKKYTIDIDRPAPKAITSSIYFSTKVAALSATNLSSLDRLINRIKAMAPRNLAATITISGGNDNSRRDLTTLRHDQIKRYLEASGIRIKSVTSIPGSPNKIEVTASWVR